METFRSIEVTTPPETADWLYDLLDFYKEQHLRYAEGDAENDLIEMELLAALRMFEHYADGRVVLETTFTEYKPCWGSCSRPMRLSLGKVTEIDSVKYFDQDDEQQTLATSDYGTDITGIPALVWLKEGESWPHLNEYRPRPVAVEYTAGWTADEVPPDVKLGIFLLASHYYRHRGDEDVSIPQGFITLANKYKTGLNF